MEERIDAAGGAEADFGFGRMNVDVHFAWRQFQKKDSDGIAARVKHVAEGIEECRGQRAVFDGAAVDREVNLRAIGTGDGRRGEQPEEAAAAGRDGDGGGRVGKIELDTALGSGWAKRLASAPEVRGRSQGVFGRIHGR